MAFCAAFALILVPFANSCIESNAEPLNKMTSSSSAICIVVNDRTLYTAKVPFDVLSRVVLPTSFDQVSTACSDPSANSTWFPNGCVVNAGSGVGNGPPTNFYVSVQGVNRVIENDMHT